MTQRICKKKDIRRIRIAPTSVKQQIKKHRRNATSKNEEISASEEFISLLYKSDQALAENAQKK